MSVAEGLDARTLIGRFGLQPLGARDWDGHLSLLAREHPGWSFAPGFEGG